MNSIRICFFLCVLGYLTPQAMRGDDWCQWRGPRANGISMEKDWRPQALVAPNIHWRINVGEGHSAATVRGNRVFILGSERIGADDKKKFHEVIYCLKADTGDLVWKYSYATKERAWPGPAASAVIEDSLLYAVGREGDLYCLNSETGEVKWHCNLISAGLTENHIYGFAGSPVIFDDLLILNAGESGIAIDKRTGLVVWSSRPVSAGLATPVLFSHAGQQLVAISSNEKTHIVEARTGRVVCTHPWTGERDPLIWEQNLFLICLKGSTLLHVQADSYQVVWQNRNKCASFQDWIEIDGYAYGMGMIKKDHVLQVINLRNGRICWTRNLPEWGSLIAADNKLIILEGKGDVVVAAADTSGYRELARALVFKSKAPVDKKQPMTSCWTNPVLANKRLYVRNTQGDLVSLDMN